MRTLLVPPYPNELSKPKLVLGNFFFSFLSLLFSSHLLCVVEHCNLIGSKTESTGFTPTSHPTASMCVPFVPSREKRTEEINEVRSVSEPPTTLHCRHLDTGPAALDSLAETVHQYCTEGRTPLWSSDLVRTMIRLLKLCIHSKTMPLSQCESVL